MTLEWNKKNREKKNEIQRRYYKNHKEKISDKVKQYREDNLEFVRERERRYYQNKKKKGTFDTEEHKQKRREWQKKYRATDKYKLKLKRDNLRKREIKNNISHSFTQKEWENKLKETEGVCPKCDTFVGIDKLTLDHILPVSLAPKGFTYTIDDVQPLCRRCNCKKNNKYNWSKGDLHHVGILVKEFDKYITLFESFGGKVVYRGLAKDFDVDCVFIDMGNTYVELIKGNNNKNPLNKFLNKYGEGLHHMALMSNKEDLNNNGALPKMKVGFNSPTRDIPLLIEYVTFKEE